MPNKYSLLLLIVKVSNFNLTPDRNLNKSQAKVWHQCCTALFIIITSTLFACSASVEEQLAATIDEQQLRSHIETLASDKFEGRAPASQGGLLTRNYLISEMKRIGLKSINGSYEQEVPLVELTLNTAKSNFSINDKKLKTGSETVFWTKRVTENVSFNNSEMIFVGYGIVAPEYNWNDYAGIDVKGKTVVMLVNDPGFATQNKNLFKGNAMTYYGRWTYKFEEAARQGAVSAIIIHQTRPAAYGWGVVSGSWSGAQLDLERLDGGNSRTVMEAWITESTAEQLFTDAGLSFTQLAVDASKTGFKPVVLEGMRTSAKLVNTIKRSKSANIAGILPGTSNPDEYLLYMAHWDHLGHKETAPGTDKISNGAVDNATGTAGILSIAEAFANASPKPKRSIMFLAVTAEESGLLGSAYFAEAPLVPLEQMVGGINIDGVLPTPTTKDLIVVGYGASELEDMLKTSAAKNAMYLRPDASPEKGYFYRSDHISLAKKGVPMLYADSGIDFVEGGEQAGLAFNDDYVRNRYHKPSDEYDASWILDGMLNTFNILYDMGATLANSDYWPNWYKENEFRALRDKQRGN